MKLRINVNIFPKDGYFFTEKDGAVIKASNNWRGVVARVIAYRRRNKLPPGDPMEEVHAQACARNPDACHDAADQVTRVALRAATLKGRVLRWLSGIRARKAKNELSFVDEATMRARASVCAGCPVHASIAGGCGACKKAVKEVRVSILGSKLIDPRVSGCSVLDEDCAVNSWLDQQTVGNAELPACCWRRRSPPA